MVEGSSLFEVLDDGRFVAQPISRGPWSPEALHGGPVGALLVGAAESVLRSTGSAAVEPVRVTLDLERPVGLDPLRIESEVVRAGRKVQVAEVRAFDPSGTRVARAAVLAIRRTPVEIPPATIRPHDELVPGPTQGSPLEAESFDHADGLGAFHRDGVEHRFVRGTFLGEGPSTDWIRLQVPVVPGVDPSPWQRTMAAADFVNGVSAVLPWDGWMFINPDLTVTLHRLPVGEWVGLDAATRVEADGVATAEAELFDEQGRIGRCVQTLLIEPRR